MTGSPEMTSTNNGSGRTWTAITDCYARALGVIPAQADRAAYPNPSRDAASRRSARN